MLWIVTRSSVIQGEFMFQDWVKRADVIQSLVKSEEVLLRAATQAQLDKLASYMPDCLSLTNAQIHGLFTAPTSSQGRKRRSLNDLKRYLNLMMADASNDNFEKRDTAAEINQITSEISTFLSRLDPALLHDFSVALTTSEHGGIAAEKQFVEKMLLGASLCSTVKGSRRGISFDDFFSVEDA